MISKEVFYPIHIAIVHGDGSAEIIEEVYGPDQESVEIDMAIRENRSNSDHEPYIPDPLNPRLASVAPSDQYSRFVKRQLPETAVILFVGPSLGQAAIDISTPEWMDERYKESSKRPPIWQG